MEKKDYGPRKYIVWERQCSMDTWNTYCIDNSMLENDHKGNWSDGTWTTITFDNMLHLLRNSFSPSI